MKNLLSIVVAAFSINAMAIEFITEAQVGEHLSANKVIEISKYSVESLIESDSACSKNFASKSARVYVVKKDNEAYLYLTPSGLNGLTACKQL